MKLKTLKLVPGLICCGVIGVVMLLHALPNWLPGFDLFQRIEWMTYDWRMRQAFAHGSTENTSLGAVFIDEESVKFINENFGYNWPWPRQFHGRLIKMLKMQKAEAIGFDILFSELHPPNPLTRVELTSGSWVESDEFLTQQLQAASNVVLAVMSEATTNTWRAIPPAPYFRTNTWAIGHVTSNPDSDGVLRRAIAYREDKELGRIWHMGIVLAARELELDLRQAEIEPNQIVLRGLNGIQRTIPVDEEGYFYINWTLDWNDPRIAKGSFAQMAGLKSIDGYPPDWRNKLVVIGSILAGNDVSDIGATSLSHETYLMSKHWNVAQSILSGRFVHPPPVWLEYLLIAAMGVLSAMLTWSFRPPRPTLAVAMILVVYVALAWWLFVQYQFWLPMLLPLVGALLMNHFFLVTYQVLFEQLEKRRVKGVFAKLVSPNIVNELLGAEKINLGGTRRQVTVLFADIRGFTEFTDTIQANAEAYVREHKLGGAEAEDYFNEQAQLTLDTVNPYMSLIADEIKSHEGTLDKYIGDCVMAYWGMPTPNEKHALYCVRAAIASQRGIYELNEVRRVENQRREQDNAVRLAAGKPPLTPLPLLALGTGINTGVVFVGLMGSDDHILNYTVFGRDVNLASRLEGVSGSSRILIGESTYLELQKYDPTIAASCIELEPVTVKGIRAVVKTYEVPWYAGETAKYLGSLNTEKPPT